MNVLVRIRSLRHPLLLLALSASAGAQGLTCSLASLPSTPADKAAAAGDFAQAETLFTAQLVSSSTASNWVGLVHTQLSQKNLVKARDSAQQALTTLPNSADAMAILGEVLTRSGEIPLASEAFIKALRIDRCSARAHFCVARLDDLTGNHSAAVKELNFAHRIAPADPEITLSFLEHLPADQRLALLRAFLASHPALPPAQLEQLATKVAILTQHLDCTTEPVANASLNLQRVLQNGGKTRSWGLKVAINQINLPLLELDSSVEGIVLNPADAAKAKVRRLVDTPLELRESYIGIADQIQIDHLTYRNCPVTVVPGNTLDDRNSLIGTSFFQDHVLHLDYVAQNLRLSPLPAAPSGPTNLADLAASSPERNWFPAYVAGGSVLVPTFINKKGPFLFALDTGVGMSVLSPAVTRSELGISQDPTLNLKGFSGPIVKVIPREGGGNLDVAAVQGPDGLDLAVTRPIKLPVYRFTSNEAPDNSAVSFDLTSLSSQAGVEISALLGFHILSYYAIDINYRDSLVRLVFDQNRRYHVQQNEREP